MRSEVPASARSLAEVVARLGRAAHDGAFAEGLNPAQWAALRYFDRANRFSRTVTAFASYHGTTQGTASQTVKALVGKGLLARRRDGGDRRSSRVEPTAAGRRALAADPLHALARAAGAMGETERRRLVDGLGSIFTRLVAGCRTAPFGECRECRYLGAGCRRGIAYRCSLLDQPLVASEIERICVNFEARA